MKKYFFPNYFDSKSKEIFDSNYFTSYPCSPFDILLTWSIFYSHGLFDSKMEIQKQDLRYTWITSNYILIFTMLKGPKLSTSTFNPCSYIVRASQRVLMVKNLPANAEDAIWVQSLNQEDPLEKEMATHSSILAWKILWTEDWSGLPFPLLRHKKESHLTFAATWIWMDLEGIVLSELRQTNTR